MTPKGRYRYQCQEIWLVLDARIGKGTEASREEFSKARLAFNTITPNSLTSNWRVVPIVDRYQTPMACEAIYGAERSPHSQQV